MFNPLTVTTGQIAERIFGANTAGNLVNQYLNIVVPDLVVQDDEIRRSGKQITTSAAAYVNNGHKVARTTPNYITPGKRNTFGSMLLQLKNNAALQDYVTFTGSDTGSITVSNSNGDLFSYSKNAVKQSFMGKGTPNQIKQAVNLMNLWRVFTLEVRKKTSSKTKKITDKLNEKDSETKKRLRTTYDHRFLARDLPVMVREFFGVDCNGFVNLYLKAKYPKLGIPSAHTMEDIYVLTTGKPGDKKKIKDNLRYSLTDIKQDDAAVFYKGHYHHIAVINAVLRRAGNEVLVNMAESRGSSAGGVQVNNFTIREQKEKGKFSIVGRKEDYVKIVSPDRWKAKEL